MKVFRFPVQRCDFCPNWTREKNRVCTDCKKKGLGRNAIEEKNAKEYAEGLVP